MRVGVLLPYLWVALGLAQDFYDFGTDIAKFTRRQSDGSRIIVGRLPVLNNSTIPRRLEIREMREDAYKWDLFILALSMFQYVNQDDPLSWYQIAGMCHGQSDSSHPLITTLTRNPRCALPDLERC
jgi:tyrosinase